MRGKETKRSRGIREGGGRGGKHYWPAAAAFIVAPVQVAASGYRYIGALFASRSFSPLLRAASEGTGASNNADVS